MKNNLHNRQNDNRHKSYKTEQYTRTKGYYFLVKSENSTSILRFGLVVNLHEMHVALQHIG